MSEDAFRFSYALAAQRRGRLTCVDKANMFRAFAFFRGISDEIGREFPGVAGDHAYVDATALWSVTQPERFDVLVTENMFGDILSDLGAGLMGGLGVAPSADIGHDHAVFQPCHGSAPDIAGQGRANPLAMILSAAMMLDWLGAWYGDDALAADGAALRAACEKVIDEGRVRGPDPGGSAGTAEMVAAVRSAL